MKKVFVAMSGGVDSSVAATLLKEQGYDVHGIFMQTWSPPGIFCTSGDDRRMAARAAAHLGIPFAVWDFRKDYKRAVVDYMMAEYAAGRTPNPDVMCNSRIKFGIFLETALKAGADFIATGHYVRVAYGDRGLTRNGRRPTQKRISVSQREFRVDQRLLQARDKNKDQSYFLWTLTQEQLPYCLFPIGDYEKREVRQMARERGLPNWDKKDSQGLCFVGKVDFSDFLRAYLPLREGVVLTTAGVKIGNHDGAQFVTVGQRHGLNLSSKYHVSRSKGNSETKVHYVAERNIATNTVVVAEENDPLLYRKEIEVTNINFISGNALQLPLQCLARIRYRQPLQFCRIEAQNYADNTQTTAESFSAKVSVMSAPVRVLFKESQKAIAPGQSAVFYTQDGILLGGGIIE